MFFSVAEKKIEIPPRLAREITACNLLLSAELWISLVANLACAAFQNNQNLRFLTAVYPSFRWVLSFNPRTVVKCSPQPPDISGASDPGDLKFLSAHIFPLFMFALSLFCKILPKNKAVSSLQKLLLSRQPNLTRLCDSPRVEHQV